MILIHCGAFVFVNFVRFLNEQHPNWFFWSILCFLCEAGLCVCVCVAELCSFLLKAGCVWGSITAASRGSPFARAAGWHCGRWGTLGSCHPTKWHAPDTPDPLRNQNHLNQNLVSHTQKSCFVVTEGTFPAFSECITDHLIINWSQDQKSWVTQYWFMFYMILIQYWFMIQFWTLSVLTLIRFWLVFNLIQIHFRSQDCFPFWFLFISDPILIHSVWSDSVVIWFWFYFDSLFILIWFWFGSSVIRSTRPWNLIWSLTFWKD